MTSTLSGEQTETPSAARLGLTFDTARLVADLERLRAQKWNLQNTYAEDGTLTEAPIDWRSLSLRSIGGDPARTDPGGPGLLDFAPTPWLAQAPYLAEVLDAIPAQLRSARLMALGPGAASAEHQDNKYGPAWGTARVHVPIVTTPGALLFIDGVQHQWQPGEFWFGDFSRLHRVENTDDVTRVHLVIDTLVSEELLELFPAADRARISRDNVVVNRAARPLPTAAAVAYRIRFDLPTSFANWEEEDGEFLRGQSRTAATVDLVDDHLVLSLDGRPTLGLVHIGDGEFRFAGWTDERTLQISTIDGTPQVTVRSRVGGQVRQLTLPAAFLD